MMAYALVTTGSSNPHKMRMNFYWFMQVKFLYPEKKATERCYGALLQHNMYASGINPVII